MKIFILVYLVIGVIISVHDTDDAYDYLLENGHSNVNIVAYGIMAMFLWGPYYIYLFIKKRLS